MKLVRGPFLKLDPHPLHVDRTEELPALVSKLRAEQPERLLAADLFSGAGGLSLGLTDAGFTVVLSVDHDAPAVETHKHHFPGLAVDWDLADADVVTRVAALIRDNGIDILAGGPPCQPFSRAGRSMIRHRVHHHQRDPHDERRDLWRSYLEVIRLARPRAVIMENVPDMALDREMFILRSAVQELELLGYSVEERVVDTWRYGVPQFRQRLIMVALADGSRFTWPDEVPEKVTVWNAIGDLPDVVGGWRPEGGAEGWTPYDGTRTAFQRRMRRDLPVGQESKLYDHITRPVREDDAKAFEAMDSGTKYSDLPAELKRYREDIFDDKYKRLDENDLSRTITAHIAKDGYWYIHPRQPRTITVREAARLQTFPDGYRFSGPPSAAFRQIGNAVPPLLGERLGGQVLDALQRPGASAVPTTWFANTLATWFAGQEQLGVPWLRATTRWQVIQAEVLLDRLPLRQIAWHWPIIERWPTPAQTLAADEELREVGRWLGRGTRAGRIIQAAVWCTNNPEALDEPALTTRIPHVATAVLDIAALCAPSGDEDEAEEPVLVTKGVLRVAARLDGHPVDRKNRLTDGRLAVARLVGGGPDAREAHRGLIELAATVCRPLEPRCDVCPLATVCVSSTVEERRGERLF